MAPEGVSAPPVHPTPPPFVRARQLPRRRPIDELSLGLRRSAWLHALAIAGVLLGSIVLPSRPRLMLPTLRVDLVGLPDVLKKDLEKVKPAEGDLLEKLKKAETDATKAKPPKPEPQADPDEMVLKPKKAADASARQDKNRAALAKIKAIEKVRQEVLLKGNRVSGGSSVAEDAQEADQATYFDVVRDRLRANWALPVWLARQKLSAQILIFLDSKGSLRSFRFVRSSGNPQFDQAIKRTLSESQPFDAPPDALRAPLLLDGILIGFPL